MRVTRALIHLDNLKENIRQIRTFIQPETKMCVAVKADAYGHGAVQCARAALEAGADFLSVATCAEGIELRNAGIKAHVLMLSLCSPDEVDDAVSAEITPLVFDSEYIGLFSDSCRKQGKRNFAVHLAVDTGMGRIGCLPSEAGEIASEIQNSGVLSLEGTATHFAMSDCVSAAGKEYTALQFRNFLQAIDSIKSAGINPGICHCANSAATLDCPQMHLGMVRPGIIVYGYYADEVSREYLASAGKPLELRPVMTVESAVSAVRPFASGKFVGYGCTWKSSSDTNIGVIPVGYADGWFRRFSQCGVKIAVGGKNYPICGRICMDQCMIDLGNSCSVKRWDKAVLFGDSSDGALQTADDIARLTGTISYEITCGISKRVPRVFIDS
ncbi:alanine racemase [Treponema sp.]|uniref:alanine racemase n=1 Tax=Treponema sp. TaxID=166 RepID=UPI003F0B9786